MKHTFRHRARRPRPSRSQIHQEFSRARRLHELLRLEQAMELKQPEKERHIGRHPLDRDRAAILRHPEQGHSPKQTAKTLQISRVCESRLCRRFRRW